MFLELSRDKIMIVLELSRDKIMTNSTPCGPSLLDPTLSLIISNFHFWYHNHYSFNYLVILVTSTQHALRTLRFSLRLAKRPSAQFANSTRYKISTDKVLRTRTPFKRRSATALLQVKQGYWSYKPPLRRI